MRALFVPLCSSYLDGARVWSRLVSDRGLNNREWSGVLNSQWIQQGKSESEGFYMGRIVRDIVSSAF